MEFSASNLELGRLYFERGDILKAIEFLEPLAQTCVQNKNYEHYLDTLHVLFRAYAEYLDFDKIEKEKERLLDLTANHGLKMSSKIYYALALCASYKNEHEQALDFSQKALAAGLAEDNKEAVCYAISGLAISYYCLDRLQDALKEIFNLQVFMDVLDLPQIRISSHILKGQILRKMGKYDQALDVLWQSYDVLKNYKNFYIQISVFIGLALTFKQAGKMNEAKNYIDLASRSIDHTNLRKLSLHVKELKDSIYAGQTQEAKHDLVFNLSEHAVFERHKGRVDFGNQFILMDLLKLFAQQPGVSFSKEQLVKHIWKQSYNPAVHDNKIYVTIKRLRQLVEPDVEKPKYIFRSKNGYYLNKDISILIESTTQRERV
ncbi:MAG: winged helix-turn-helix domain-containing protein [Bdellovibrionaceae bacterium]|nr:winged helix-turn-helix domain-containing protein [Pseudobdellovibrionaceae bacterium]